MLSLRNPTMRATSILPLSLLAAAASLQAQTVTVLSGGVGAETVTHSQAFDTTGNLILGAGLEVEYLVVGGGGGGGGGGSSTSAWGTGGGGAGGMLTGTKILTLSTTSAANVFAVSVGAGGAGGQKSDTVANQQGSNGANSSFLDVVALGGGGGGGNKLVGGVGGSGGGGGGRGTGTNLRTAGGAGTEGQGFAGGASRDDNSNGRSAGGGGGGAGGLGGQGGTDTTSAGNGGLGLASSITGTSLMYAGGGGGGAIDTNIGAGETPGTGGSGIGGAGSISGNGGSGLDNTGSGGGGVGTNGIGGSGGSGVVVLRYQTAAVAGTAGLGGAVSTGAGSAEGYTVHQFNATGSSSLNLSSLDLANQRMVTKTSGAFSGSGYLAFNSPSLTTPSTFILTGNSSAHSGLNILNAGATVQVGDGGTSGALGSGDIYLNQGASLVFNRADDITVGNKLTGNTNTGNLLNQGSLVKRGAGKLTLTNTASYYGVMQVEEGELVHDRGVSVGTPYIRGQISEGATYTLVDNRDTPGYGYGGYGLATSGAGQLVLEGTARISLYSYSGFTSGLAHTGGTVIKGMAVKLDGGQIAQGSSLTIQENGTLSFYGSIDLGDVRVESGSLSGIYITATSLEVDTGSISAGIVGATPLLKTGAGEFIVNSFQHNRSGANRIEDGILTVVNISSLGKGATTVAGGNLRFRLGASATASIGALILDGGTVDYEGLGGTRFFHAESLDLRSGSIGVDLVGKAALTKTTAGTVTLGGNNGGYHGIVTVSEGTLRLLSTQGLGSSSTVFLDGGTLELAGNTRVGYFEQAGGTVIGGTLVSSLVLTESGTFGSALADDIGGASGILKRTSGTTQVTAANTFTGGIRVDGGTLQLAGAGSFNAAAYLIAMTGGTLDIGGKTQTLSGIDGNGAIALGDGGALTVAFESRASVFAGVISGDGSLTKSGAGHLFLLGDNTYTGATLVTGGKLAVNGALASSSLAIHSGATLGGSGTIAGATVISGIHAPGNSPGLQTFGSSLTYQAGAEIQWELAGQTDAAADRGMMFDGIDVAGDLTFSGATLVSLAFDLAGSSTTWSDSFWSANHSWKLLDVGGSVFGFENLSLGDTSLLLDSLGESFGTALQGSQFSLALRSGDIFVDYTAAAIPEPSAYGLVLGGLILAGSAIRRRRNR